MDSRIVKHKPFLFLSLLFSIAIFILIAATARKNVSKYSTLDIALDPSWPPEVVPIEYVSSADNTLQPALFYKPNTNEPAPLLVALHTWTGDYLQNLNAPFAEWCVDNDWVFIHPNFRGPNNKPEATGSDLVIQDILSAVDFAKQHSNVDLNRIYLVGASGGGHAALLVSALHPDIWAGVSVWVPVTDLSVWYDQVGQLDRQYLTFLEQSMGGAPGTSPEVDLAYKNRSPITYLSTSTPINLDINAGIHDGHDGLVPISHSLLAYNALTAPEYHLSEQEIQYFVGQAQVPQHLIDPLLSDSSFGERAVLFRRQTENVRLTLFDGGHEILFEPALMWLAQQEK